MNTAIAKLLQYSFDGIDWEFSKLTKTEQEIVGSQDMLTAMKRVVDIELTPLNKLSMVQITSGPYAGAIGYLSFDEKSKGVLSCRLEDGTWLEFAESEVEFEPYVIDR